MTIPPEVLAKITQAIEKGIPFAERTGIRVEALERGYVKMRMPFEPNVNHVGMMYAGALFTLAEIPGGAIFATSFDMKRFYPIVKDMSIRFRRPARSDITVEVRISEEQVAEIQERADRDDKADYDWECQLKDVDGEVVAVTKNLYQMRKIGS